MNLPPFMNARTYWLAAVAAGGLLTVTLVVDLFASAGPGRELERLVQARAAMVQADEETGRSASTTEPTTGPTTAPGTQPQTQPPRPDGPAPQDPTPADKLAQRVLKRNVFSAPKAFQAKLVGVLGDQVFFEGDPAGYSVGGNFRGASIKQIGADWAQLEFNGKPVRLGVYEGGPPGGGGGGGPSDRRGRSRAMPPEALMMGGGMPAGMPEEVRAEMMKRMEAARQAAQQGGGGMMMTADGSPTSAPGK